MILKKLIAYSVHVSIIWIGLISLHGDVKEKM